MTAEPKNTARSSYQGGFFSINYITLHRPKCNDGLVMIFF